MSCMWQKFQPDQYRLHCESCVWFVVQSEHVVDLAYSGFVIILRNCIEWVIREIADNSFTDFVVFFVSLYCQWVLWILYMFFSSDPGGLCDINSIHFPLSKPTEEHVRNACQSLAEANALLAAIVYSLVILLPCAAVMKRWLLRFVRRWFVPCVTVGCCFSSNWQLRQLRYAAAH